MLSIVLWYNSQISKTNLFYPDWFNNGIHTIADIVASDGAKYDYKILELNYNLNINILNYYTVKGLVKKIIDHYRGGNDFKKTLHMPLHIKILFNVDKERCSRRFYLELNNTESDVPLCKIKCNNEFDYLLHKVHWKVLHKICFQSLTDNSFVWFQYRIL